MMKLGSIPADAEAVRHGSPALAPRSGHPRDPLHGITLESIVNGLVARHGWVAMGERIPVRCFQINPSVNSALKFLRKTDWARRRVEAWYIEEHRSEPGE